MTPKKLLISSLVCGVLWGQSATESSTTKPLGPNAVAHPPTPTVAEQAAPPPAHQDAPQGEVPHSPYKPNRFPKKALIYYSMNWGVDSPAAKWTESGEVIRFTWRVVDPEKAKVLNDKKLEPEMIDPQAGVKLSVPALENIGTLRQSGTPVAGKLYWMAFSNKGRLVKRGDRVDVVIGQFHADGLLVE